MTGNNIACWWLHAAESGLTSGLPVLSINKGGGEFLKKLWCCIGGDVKHKILDLSTELIR